MVWRSSGILALALYLPMFGLTLAVVLLAERVVVGRLPAARGWLGLRARELAA